jgi:hypothetical protein
MLALQLIRVRRMVLGACASTLGMALLWMALSTPAAQASACAAQNNYEGAVNGAWTTGANWSKGKEPTGAETACIPAGDGTITIAEGVKAEVKLITVQSALTVASKATLTITEKASASEELASHFAALTVNGTIATDGDWLLISGDVLLEGEITANGTQTQKNETTARLLSGTLTGDGAFGIGFNNIGGTIEPGGAGTIGKLHFNQLSSQQAAGTLVLDIKSATEFDELAVPGTNFFFNEGTKIHINLLGSYDPEVKTKWLISSGDAGFDIETEEFEPESFTMLDSGSGMIEVERVAAPPVVITEPASFVEATAASLNGSVNPSDVDVTKCEFEYGTTTSYGSIAPCSSFPGGGKLARPVEAEVAGLEPGTTYHFRTVATNSVKVQLEKPAVELTRMGADMEFTTAGSKPKEKEKPVEEKMPEEKSSGGITTTTTTTSGGGGATAPPTISPSTMPGAIPTPVATAPKAVEELLLGCSSSPLVLNDAYIHDGRVLLIGSAAKSLVGKKVKILFNEGKQVATATVGANGQYATTAPLPPAKIREALSTRYTAEVGKVRSLHLKLTRRLLLEPPRASGTTVTLSGQLTLPLTKPVAPVIVEQQLECGKTVVAKTFIPPANGHFNITLTVPANARAGIFRLTSKVAADTHAVKHGFTTFSLPLPVTLG